MWSVRTTENDRKWQLYILIRRTIVPYILFGLQKSTQADVILCHDSVEDVFTAFRVSDG